MLRSDHGIRPTATPTVLDCNAFANNNAGCGVQTTVRRTAMDPRSTGIPAGGAWIFPSCSSRLSFDRNVGAFNSTHRYAIERTPTFIKDLVLAALAPITSLRTCWNGASSVNTDNWGSPTANFPNTQCDINGKFGPANIIINLTFCEFSVRGTGLTQPVSLSRAGKLILR
jgi:hypothetical protein